MNRDRDTKPNHTTAARDTSPSPPAETGAEPDTAETSEAEGLSASRAADAIPVVLDPFVLRLVPTARHARPAGSGHPAASFTGAAPSSADDRDSLPQADGAPSPAGDEPITQEQVRDHLRRRAIFLRELAEARELRERVTPHRSRRARIHAALRHRTFRLN
ncbi:hypothetical protein [Spirillospora sp. NPDC047279]|uniref:hypothetical protein n=1 Tax=Spirillospora sp. NPDC047279 TaxID=3155478 RepID=UPI0033D16F78